ncbi:lysine-specific demethylase 4B-like [Nilaparvata lugens]|uniref:lysine-specific demethylase 4B-like n=1 Tax=Nilaparvata lugens TaxID=108931 RepID=UPI00193E5309|nr:lysine-specific demethylase 4B-like [Nilaparvata lugens]
MKNQQHMNRKTIETEDEILEYEKPASHHPDNETETNSSPLPTTTTHMSVKCWVCSKAGGLVHCCDWSCSRWFHVTCALAKGCHFRISRFQGCKFFVTCSDHPHTHSKTCGIQMGQWVWARKDQIDRYHRGQVVGVSHCFYFNFEFPDGSYTDMLREQDIIEYGKNDNNSYLTTGTPMRVKWTDGEEYIGTYQGHEKRNAYTVNNFNAQT